VGTTTKKTLTNYEPLEKTSSKKGAKVSPSIKAKGEAALIGTFPQEGKRK